jgi:hypothetical protein
MKKDNLMEDDLRAEYDLKDLKVRKLGSERKAFGNIVLNDVENEIDFLINTLEKSFISRRTKFQEQLIYLQKNTNWKIHRRYFQVGIAVSLALFFVLLKSTVELSKSENFQNYKYIGIILLFSSLFFLLAVMIFISFDQFASIVDNFRTYQDEINSIRKTIKKNIRKNDFYIKNKKSNISGFVFLKSHFEYRIRKIENNLKIIEPLSYLFAILCILCVFLIYGSHNFIDFLLRDSTKYTFLLGILLFLIAVIQSTLKVIAYNSGYSLIGKHQECLLLLEEMEIILGSSGPTNLALQSPSTTELSTKNS